MTAERIEATDPADKNEVDYIRAMSRPDIVQAYSKWKTVSEAENYILRNYVGSNSSVLDLGCGAGRMLDVCGDKFANYLGVDGSEEMISSARKKHPAASFTVGDITSISFEQNRFDTALLMHNVLDTLSPLPRRASVLQKVNLVLPRGGLLVCSSHILLDGVHQNDGYYSEDYHGTTVTNYRSAPSSFCEEVERNGFDVQIVMRDRRAELMDWVYIAALVK